MPILTKPPRQRFPRRLLLIILTMLLSLGPWLGSVADAQPSTPTNASPCVESVEPNDEVEDALDLGSGDTCATAENLQGGGQDLYTWTVSDDLAKQRWSMDVSGIPDQVVLLEVYRVELDDTGGIATATKLISVGGEPSRSASAPDLFWSPGIYTLGVASSGPGPYTLIIEPGAPVADTPLAEPIVADGELNLGGVLSSTTQTISWNLDEETASTHHDLVVQAPVGSSLSWLLADETGVTRFSNTLNAGGRSVLPDLGLNAGTYTLTLNSSESMPWSVQTTPSTPRTDADEDEPNDDSTTAMPLVWDGDTASMAGRFGTNPVSSSDRDVFALTIDDAHAGRFTDIRMIWQGEHDRGLCLLTEEGEEIRCATSATGFALDDLVLAEGTILVQVSGELDAQAPYTLKVTVSGEAVEGFEQEPNNAFGQANALVPAGDSFTSAGRTALDDDDYFRLTITDEPQLWLVEVVGDQIDSLDFMNAAGSTQTTGRSDGSGVVALYDLYLLPGDSLFRVTGKGDYTITATPLGPPDPAFELEPNDSADRSMPIALLEERSGRLSTINDVDTYRLALPGETRIRLTLDVPSDAMVLGDFTRGAADILAFGSTEPGGDIAWEGTLPAGDYQLRLNPTVPSAEPYALTIIPLDPFLVPDDSEPNDSEFTAATMPPGGQVSGSLNAATSDVDWFRLNPLERAGQVVLTFPPEITAVLYVPSESPGYPMSLPSVSGIVAGQLLVDVPADEPLLLEIRGVGDYTVRVDPVSNPGTVIPTPAAAEPSDLKAELSLEVDAPAAYWPEGQRVAGTLVLTNSGPSEVSVDLTSQIAHFLWQVEITADPVVVPAGESVSVPLALLVAPDARADVPVMLAIQADMGDGRASGTVLVTPQGSAVPVAPFAWHSVPAVVEGGLNVAWAGLGGVSVVDDVNAPTDPHQLYNEIMRAGDGLSLDTSLLPISLTVDLAGDEPVPVAGIVIYPAGLDAARETQLRGYELQLSADGISYTTVATGDLSGDLQEYVIPLDESVEARFARLVVTSAQHPTATRVYLGEWKVLADPTWTLADDPLDLANIATGGHVVAIEPPASYSAITQTLLIPDDERQTLETAPDATFNVVVGFHHNRAAQVERLVWVDPPDAVPESQVTAVQLEISTGGSTGPWEPIGTFDLERDEAGRATFVLDTPVWARFVRVTAMAGGIVPEGDDARTWELPGQLIMQEEPASSTYRSALGEWGTNASATDFEALNPTEPVVLDADAGNDQASASSLQSNQRHTDVASFGTDDDWYEISIPEGEPLLAITLTGLPTLGVETHLFANDGTEVPTSLSTAKAGDLLIEAEVEPGVTYFLQVTQAPSSVVFAYDTSFSIGVLEPTVYQGLLRFARDVQPGREFVNVLPFGSEPLLETWSDDPYLLQSVILNYPRNSTSSDAEGALVTSDTLLADQPGNRAIILITDAENDPTYETMVSLWPGLAATMPRIFAVNIAGSSDITIGQDLMQDWAMVNHGGYVYASSQGDMDVAFDRAATELRRPSIYALSYSSASLPPTPTPLPPTPTPAPTPTPDPTVVPTPAADGTLRVLMPETSAEEPPQVAPAAAGQVALILDTSGSMLQDLNGQTRADVARNALIDLVTTTIPPGTTVSLRTFGDTPESCETLLVVPASPLDPATMANTIASLPVINLVRTPIGAALEAVEQDLAGSTGPKIVVLVTDGEETCGGDAAAAIEALVDSGVDVRVNIVGFAIDDTALQATFAEWAALGNGQYFDASNAEELNTAVALAVQPAFDVLDANGTVVASGQVGGEPIALPPGTYQIVVRTNPEVVIDTVTVISAQPTEINVPE